MVIGDRLEGDDMSDDMKVVIILVAAAGIIFCISISFFENRIKLNQAACRKIDAEYYHRGRDFSACVKQDGSMWRVPR